MRPATIALPSRPAPAFHQIPRPRRRAEAPSLRPAQAHRPSMAGRRLSPLRRRHLSRPRCFTARSPTWPASASRPPSPKRSKARTRSKPSSTPTTRAAPPSTSISPRPNRPAGKPIPASATSIGSCATAIGKPSSAASPKRTRASVPTSRTRASAWKSRISWARTPRKYLPDFIVQVDDGHARLR